MKKINSSGFVMAETLIVTVFLTVIFAMLYSSFLPFAGEYEKRENYDNIDGKYAVYWIKRIIEDSSYNIPSGKENYIKERGYIRFECSDVTGDDEKRAFCINMVRSLQVSGCDKYGDKCDIFITRYRLNNVNDSSRKWFKEAMKDDTKKYQENYDSVEDYVADCLTDTAHTSSDSEYCNTEAEKRLFSSGFRDYVFFLPEYTAKSLNYANYRVIARFHNRKDNNNYYSYATIEVSR